MSAGESERLIGRTAELTTIDSFVGAEPGGLRVVMINGPEGIGRSALWNAAVTGMTAAGRQPVLRAAPVAGEAQLEQVVLHDLLDQVPGSTLDALSPVARQVLDVVRLVSPATEPIGLRQIGAALLELVRELARTERPVLAVDDLPWVDPASARVLAYVLRRATDIDLVFVGVWPSPDPTGTAAELWSDLFRTITVPVCSVDVGPLDLHELDHLLVSRFGVPPSRPELHELHHRSGGNPSVAIELLAARAAGDADLVTFHERSWQDTRSWERARVIVQAEIERLPAGERRWLQALSIAHAHSRDLATRLALRFGIDVGSTSVSPTVLVLDGSTARFRHPLLREAVAGTLSPGERSELHAVLADSEDTAQARALHRLAAHPGPDAALADELERAARQAIDRGSRHIGAHLWQRAAAATPADDRAARRRRLMEAWARLLETADPAAARVAATEACEVGADGEQRAEALLAVALTYVHGYALDPEALRYCEAAVAASAPGAPAAGYAHLAAALFLLCRPQDPEAARGHLEQAAATRPADADADLRTGVDLVGRLVDYATTAWCDDGPVIRDLRTVEDPVWYSFLGYSWGLALSVGGRYDAAATILNDVLDRWRDVGVPIVLPSVLLPLALCELALGRPGRALELTEQAQVQARTLHRQVLLHLQGTAALALGRLGRFPQAREQAAAAWEAMVEATAPSERLVPASALAGLWLQLDEHEQALAVLDVLHPLDELTELSPEAVFFWAPPAMETFAAAGELERAQLLRDRLAPLCVALDLPVIRSQVARVSALLARQAGRRDEAWAHVQEMLDQADNSGDPWLQGLRRIHAARLAGRLRRVADGSAWLDEAETHFAGVGATGWLSVVAAERRQLVASGPLSSTELAVARLLADGRSNREIADGLAISPKTVERHLTSSYRKLELPSRTALAAWYLREHGS